MAIDTRLTRIARAAHTSAEPRTHTQLRADALTTLLLGDGVRSRHAEASSRGDQARNGRSLDDSPLGSASAAGRLADALPADHAPSSPVAADVAVDADDSAGLEPGDYSLAATPPVASQDERFEIDDAFLGIVPTVVVTVPALSLLGHDAGAAELHGFGPIDIRTARRLAARAPSFVRILTHPDTGETISVGRTRYRPPPDLRLALLLDDESCRFPNCNRRAESCELDHTADWAHGGETGRANLHHLCPKHHHLKHDSTGWSVAARPGRTLEWRSPTGRHYVTAPRDRASKPARPTFVPAGDPQGVVA
ncbi:HNH endonuclease [Herbiconiux sp. CPCC 205763]|uniref:HNH endonuclease n=1 Tax=Herbiconiux aconitum TaxID=2970913 RepID=A0ABT2GTV3_9MICO|nr:HNH endonuclease signature motif containing protein [Herbiconiux aconitum]MCS5719653.1 HNH endonuclease [Herbiconiux aconitum]